MKSFTPDDIIYPNKKRPNLPNFSSSTILNIILVIIVLFALRTSFYTVKANEVAVVQRFGKYVRTSPPGLHFKIPLGIEKATPVKVEYIYKDEFGFRTRKAGVKTVYDAKSYPDESLMLTGDLNVLDVEWVVQYKVKDPMLLLFNIRDPVKALRDISESIMREVVGDYTFNEVLTTKRVEVNDLTKQRIQEVLDEYQTGIEIITIKLQDVNPPGPVKPAFNEVNEAKQEREEMINSALKFYNEKIPEARGKAIQMIQQAEGYALERVNRAKGDAERFLFLLEEYKKAKDVTRKRLYLEYMQEILKKSGKKYVIDSDEKGILPLLRLEE